MLNLEQIQLDFRAKVPLYIQLSGQIRIQLEQGALQADEQLPPVRDLAERLRVNFNTVARAYRLLDIEGWISSQQGRGTYITTLTWPRPLATEKLPEAPFPAAEPLTHEEAREETLAPSIPLASGSTQESGSEPDAVSGDLSARQAAIAQILDKAAELGITPDEIQIYLQAKLTTAESRLDFHWRHPARQRQPKDNRLRRSLGIHASDAFIGLISGRMPYPTRRQKRNPVT